MDSAWGILAEVVSLLAAAFLLGLIAERLRQDIIIGHLLAGMLLGPYFLKAVHSIQFVQLLAELGVALLLFTIGLEFSLRRLRLLGKLALAGGAMQLGFSVLLIFPVARLFGLKTEAAFVVGAALALSSTAVVLRVLSSRSEVDSAHGRGALGILLFQDVALVPLLILISVLSEGKRGADGVLEVGIALAKAVALGCVLYVLLRFVFPKLFRDSQPQRLREVPVVLAMATCLACTWASHALGLSPALGAFAGGVMLGDLPFAHQIRADVVPLRAVFVTLFFASIGMLAVPPEFADIPLILALTLLILLLKTAAAAMAMRFLKLPSQTAVHIGVLVCQIGEFSFVLLTTAGMKNLLDSQTVSYLISASVLTLLVTPYLFSVAPKIASLFGSPGDQRLAESDETERRVIVSGFGPAGREVVRALDERGFSPYVIELNPATSGANVHFGDATRPEILESARIRSALALVVTVPDPRVAQSVINTARGLVPDLPIIVRSRYHRYLPDLLAAGSTLVVDEEQSVGRLLAAQVLKAVHPPAEGA